MLRVERVQLYCSTTPRALCTYVCVGIFCHTGAYTYIFYGVRCGRREARARPPLQFAKRAHPHSQDFGKTYAFRTRARAVVENNNRVAVTMRRGLQMAAKTPHMRAHPHRHTDTDIIIPASPFVIFM